MKSENNVDVKEFYKFIFDELISIVSLNDEGYVTNINNEIEKKNGKLLRVYDTAIENIKDIEIINPLAESIGKVMPKGNRYFYTALALGLKLKIVQIIASMSEALESEIFDKDKSTAIINFISGFKDFDAKVIEEIKTIVQDLAMPLEFVNVYYNSNRREAVFRTVVFEDDFIEKYRKEYKIRKKTLVFLIEFMKSLLGIKDIKEVEKFCVKATSLKCPMLQSILHVYYLIYKAANPIFQIFDMDIDINKLKQFIDNIDAYSDKARWLTPSLQATKSTQQPKTRRSKLEQLLSHSMPSVPKFLRNQQSTSKLSKLIGTPIPNIPYQQSFGYYSYGYQMVNQPINYQQPQMLYQSTNKPITIKVG